MGAEDAARAPGRPDMAPQGRPGVAGRRTDRGQPVDHAWPGGRAGAHGRNNVAGGLVRSLRPALAGGLRSPGRGRGRHDSGSCAAGERPGRDAAAGKAPADEHHAADAGSRRHHRRRRARVAGECADVPGCRKPAQCGADSDLCPGVWHGAGHPGGLGCRRPAGEPDQAARGRAAARPGFRRDQPACTAGAATGCGQARLVDPRWQSGVRCHQRFRGRLAARIRSGDHLSGFLCRHHLPDDQAAARAG